MTNHWNTQYISSHNIDKISRGKSKVTVKYLQQFQKLIPPKITLLQVALQQEDRKSIRQILHNICPQLQFFGMEKIVPSIQHISKSYQEMAWDELADSTVFIIDILEQGIAEVDQVLRTQF